MGSTPEIANLVRSRYETPDGLIAAGELTQAVITHPGWRHVMSAVDELVARIDHELDGAREPLTQAQYAQRHARRAGLRAVEEIAQTIVRVSEAELARQRAKHEGIAEPVPQEIV